MKVLNNILLGGSHFDGLHGAKKFTNEASHFATRLTKSAAVMFDASGGEIGDDANDDHGHQRHQGHCQTDVRHEVNGYGDNQQANHHIVDKNHKKRNLIHVSFEAAHGFAR